MPFTLFGLNPALVRSVKELNFARPTPVQEQAIKPAMQGHDLLVSAATGSGKTAAFLLPVLHRLIENPRKPAPGTPMSPRALVLTPTRELAAQIHEHFLSLVKFSSLRGAPVFGGVSMRPQEYAFRNGTEVIIATPGRLLDHLRHPYAQLSGIEILILDEADRMLDMGFLPDIKRIMELLPKKRQTLFFSATMPPEIKQLTQQMLVNPVHIQIERHTGPAVSIEQSIHPVPSHLKSALLLKLLQGEKGAAISSVICFTRTKHRANRLADYLARHDVVCAAIHGNRSQAQRTAALDGFKDGRHRVLVATDIAARGIDVSGVSHVINFDCPHLPEDYIHRVGRTSRAEATGEAFTFVSQDEDFDLRKIERAINKKLPRVTLPDFDYKQAAQEKLEIPPAERIAKIRAEKAAARERKEAKFSRGHGHFSERQGDRRDNRPRPFTPHQQPQNQQDRQDRQQDQGHAPHPRQRDRIMVPPRRKPHFGEHFGDRHAPRGEMASRSNVQGKPAAGDLHRQASNNPGRRKPHLPGHGGPRKQGGNRGNFRRGK